MQLQPGGHPQEQEGPKNDVVMRCRVRLARNIAGFPFVNSASESQCGEVVHLARSAISGSDIGDLMWVDMHGSTTQDRALLVERHLVSRNFADSESPRAVGVSNDEAMSIMVNEEDHLRMQVMAPGMQLSKLYERINTIDDEIETKLDYAFDERWGYLTACPTNVGTGIRFSVMMHLPALKITNEIERVRRAARDLHLAVRGYYGEGSESAGDFYQISNQRTLGRTEDELLEEFAHRIVPQVMEYEQRARQMLLSRNAVLLDDRIHRALGTLRSARLLGTEEAMKLLSRVRLGVHLRRIEDIHQTTIDRLFLEVQPAHLRQQAGGGLESDELRAARASLVRRALG